MIVQELDGRYRKMLYRNVFKLPRALAIYPQIGYVYGTDWGQSPFIARAAMDGSHFQKIITEGLVWPNGLAIDIYSQKLFWVKNFQNNFEGKFFEIFFSFFRPMLFWMSSNVRNLMEAIAAWLLMNQVKKILIKNLFLFKKFWKNFQFSILKEVFPTFSAWEFLMICFTGLIGT